MKSTPEKEIPWELIADSLTGNLDATGEETLQKWILQSDENREKFGAVKKAWETGFGDFPLYRMADADKSWELLKNRMQAKKDAVTHPSVRFRFRPMYAYAAAFAGIVLLGIWMMMAKGRFMVYETAMNQVQTVELKDGTAFTMKPFTRIEVPRNYNQTSRKVIMKSGEAWFDVIHNPEKPFSVELGKISVNDIGTSFTIRKSGKSVDLAVSSGIAAIRHAGTGESRKIMAGSAVTFDIRSKTFSTIRKADPAILQTSLKFKDASLAEVLNQLITVFSKKIVVPADLGSLKFTGQLAGLSFTESLDVICRSLGLQYRLEGETYMIQQAEQ
jgi:transmembrane sensor